MEKTLVLWKREDVYNVKWVNDFSILIGFYSSCRNIDRFMSVYHQPTWKMLKLNVSYKLTIELWTTQAKQIYSECYSFNGNNESVIFPHGLV